MITIDTERHEVIIDGRYLDLPPLEFKILVALEEADGKVMTRRDIYKKIKPGEKTFAVYCRTIDQHIARLRRKLGQRRGLIKTIATRGYKFNERA